MPIFAPQQPELTKTDACNVTYWLRLLIALVAEDGKAPSRHWSTHPIQILPPAAGAAGGV